MLVPMMILKTLGYCSLDAAHEEMVYHLRDVLFKEEINKLEDSERELFFLDVQGPEDALEDLLRSVLLKVVGR